MVWSNTRSRTQIINNGMEVKTEDVPGKRKTTRKYMTKNTSNITGKNKT